MMRGGGERASEGAERERAERKERRVIKRGTRGDLKLFG